MKKISEQCYSKNEDDWKVQDLNEFLSDLEDNDELVVGRNFCVGEPAYPCPTNFFHAGTLVDTAKENAYCEFGEHAEIFGDDIDEAAKEELEDFINAWAKKHVKVSFYHVQHIKHLAVTQQMIDSYKAEK